METELNLFKEILDFDSTSGKELGLSQFLEKRLAQPLGGIAPAVQTWDIEGGGRNLLFGWGSPRVVFCTHIDTVPPYIPPRIDGETIWGRGSCDAKGQIMALYGACRAIAEGGGSDFALLLLSGEETGSFGAKAFAKTAFRAPYLIIGEPTENKMVSASKGTKAFGLTFEGEPFHSGYPQFGNSAVDAFCDFVSALRDIKFPSDPVLGETTWNIGRLASDNPQNVLSPLLTCRLYFRTTFASDTYVSELIPSLANSVFAEKGEASGLRSYGKSCITQPRGGQKIIVEALGGDAPANYLTLPGFGSAPAAFGSDAPHLSNFDQKIICGAGSIRFAHRDDEHITIKEIQEATELYVAMYKALI